MQAQGTVSEVRLSAGRRSAYIACEAGLVPAPGRYVLAHKSRSTAPIAAVLFAAAYYPNGFSAASPVPDEWQPGDLLDIRGPLGFGFDLPQEARRVGLVAFDDDPSRLLPLAHAALRQEAAVALVCQTPPTDVPLQLEIHARPALSEILSWCDYAAFDVLQESVEGLRGETALRRDASFTAAAQVLVRGAMPCGALAECGVCTVRTSRGPRLACVEGPVFDLDLLIRER